MVFPTIIEKNKFGKTEENKMKQEIPSLVQVMKATNANFRLPVGSSIILQGTQKL